MTPSVLYGLAGVATFGVGLAGMFVSDHAVRRVIAANLTSSGVFLVLVALARRAPGDPPDPVPHALVLTGIVVSVSMTGLALGIARRLYAEAHEDDG